MSSNTIGWLQTMANIQQFIQDAQAILAGEWDDRLSEKPTSIQDGIEADKRKTEGK